MNYFYNSKVNQMLADNFWQQWVNELNKDRNILNVPIQLRPIEVKTSQNTNAVLLGTAGLLATGLILSAIIKNK